MAQNKATRKASDLGRTEVTYDGIRRTGQITRTRAGYLAQMGAGFMLLGTFGSRREAAKAIYDADKAMIASGQRS